MTDKRYAKPCIFHCGKAVKEHGAWSCPMFKKGVDNVVVETDDGVRCRKYRGKDG